MDETVHNEDLLLRYLDGELPVEERVAVEQRLQTDAALRSRLADLQVAAEAIRQLGTLQQVEAVHREMMQELKQLKPAAKVFPIRKIMRFSLAVAASLMVLVIGIRLYMNAQLSPDSLYSEAFVDFDVSATRSNSGQLSNIETLYQQKEYGRITTTVRSLNLSAKDSLLIGLSYLQLKKFSQATGWFNSISASGGEYRQDAEFYLALSYLQNREYNKSLPLFAAIHDQPAHLYREQITDDLLEKMRRLSKK